MTTTIVRDSIVGDAWIQQTSANVPIQRVIDQETGEPTGDILTGPVRLAFETLFVLPKPTPSTPNPKYGASLLFPPTADFSILYEEYYALCGQHFADRYDAGTQQYYGLHSPFKDQAEKAKFGGFTPGLVYISATSMYKPPIVDARNNPIVDQTKAYPGVWAICAINAYVNLPDKQNPAKKIGVAFGLQSVMIIGDDTKFGGGAPDPAKTFAATSGMIQAPAISATAVQGMPPGGAPSQPPQGGMPPPPQGGTYAAPPQPAAPGQYQMPGQPAQAAPAPSGDPRGPVPDGFTSWAEYDEFMG